MKYKDAKFFLDLDGVCIDFLGSAARWYGIDKKIEGEGHWPIGEWGDDKTMESFYELNTADFWEGLTDDFWATADWQPDGKEIYGIFKDLDTCVLTSPSWTGAGGKQQWIAENMPDMFRQKRYIISPAKGDVPYFFNRDVILVDDSDHNIEMWRYAGGHGILVPRYWNKNYMIGSPVTFLEGVLNAL